MAVEDINSNLDILNTHKLVMSINDGMCEADVVMKRFIDIIKTKDTSRFRSTVGMLGYLTQHYRTLFYSYFFQAQLVPTQWSP